MARQKTAQAKIPNVTCDKGSQSHLVLLSLALASVFALSSCTTQSEKGAKPADNKFSEAKKADQEIRIKSLLQITEEAHNSQGSFSIDGKKIVYTSFARSEHANTQVYEMLLDTKRHTRVTYSDGSIVHPFYFNEEGIFYSSTTDEEKENPDFTRLTGVNHPSQSEIENQLAAHLISPRTEVYYRNTKKDKIERLTKTPDPDVVYDFDSAKKLILVSSLRPDKASIALHDYNGKLVRELFSQKSPFLILAKLNSQKTEVAYVTYDGATAVLNFMDLAKKTKSELKLRTGFVKSLSLSPDAQYVLVTANFADPKNDDLYLIKRDGSCVERLTFDPAPDLDAEFSPDSKQILMTSQRSGSYQIYLAEISQETAPACLP